MSAQFFNPTKHVLVVDDHPDLCRALAKLLQFAGASATCAIGGGEALAVLAEATPDLILLDLMMPGIDGLEVLRRVREDPRTAGVPVVVFSALSDPLAMDRAIRAGATDYWVKAGLDLDMLRRRVSPYLTN